MNCLKCSSENPDGAGFCISCGVSIAGDADSASTKFGLRQNIAALLSYVLGFITGLVFFLLEKDNDYVRFHAMQSMIAFGSLAIIAIVLYIFALIPFIGIIFTILLWIVFVIGLLSWLLLMITAYQGERFLLPPFGELAERETYGRRQI